MTFSSRANRLIGQTVDGLVGGGPLLLLALFGPLPDRLQQVATIGALVWLFFYYLLADGLPGGQSFAKRWLGMRVVDAKTGEPCTFGQSFVRNVLLLVLGPFDWVFIFGAQHQRLGDKAAGTFVLGD